MAMSQSEEWQSLPRLIARIVLTWQVGDPRPGFRAAPAPTNEPICHVERFDKWVVAALAERIVDGGTADVPIAGRGPGGRAATERDIPSRDGALWAASGDLVGPEDNLEAAAGGGSEGLPGATGPPNLNHGGLDRGDKEAETAVTPDIAAAQPTTLLDWFRTILPHRESDEWFAASDARLRHLESEIQSLKEEDARLHQENERLRAEDDRLWRENERLRREESGGA